jgi:hypothetical protein
MLLFILKKLFLRLIRYVCDIFTHANDLFNMALGRDKLIYSEGAGKFERQASYARAAIVALYPDENSLPFAANLMNGLNENGFFVLAIIAKKIPANLSQRLQENCHVLIERFPIGRDFGSYKMGLDWIEKQPEFKNVDTIALANDSMFYPQHITHTIRDLLALGSDWLGLFENFQTRRHVQSFFEVFRAPILKSASFKKYWKKYLPLSSRTHSICKGETGLTSTLIRAGFNPLVLYNSTSIRESLIQKLDDNNAEQFSNIAHLLVLACQNSRMRARNVLIDESFYLTLFNDLTGKFANMSADIKKVEIAQRIAASAEVMNPTHAVGLACNLLFNAPVKRDLCYRKILYCCDLLPYVHGFSEQEKKCMLSDMTRRGFPASFPSWTWRSLKQAAGVV